MRHNEFCFRERTTALAVLMVCALTLISCDVAAEPPVPSAVSPSFSPDGATVAFSLVTGSQTEIAIAPSAGGKPRVLVTFGGKAEGVQWFPDGKALLVADGETPRGLWRVPLEGTVKKRLAQGEGPSLSPAGRTLAYLAGGQVRLLAVSSGRVTTAGPTSAEGWRMGDWPYRVPIRNGAAGPPQLLLSKGGEPVLRRPTDFARDNPIKTWYHTETLASATEQEVLRW